MKVVLLISELLKDRESFIHRILYSQGTGMKVKTMFVLSIVMFATYGFLIGISHSVLQAFSSAIKLPLLFYITSFICFPTLYFFLSFLGIKQDVKQLFSFMVLCNTFIAMTMAVFGPVAFFFLISSYTYALYKMINFMILGIAGLTGIYIFYREIKGIITRLAIENSPGKLGKGILFIRLWAIMFMVIGLQLSFTLSPYFGIPGKEFMFFTNENSNVFGDIANTLNTLGGGR